MRKAAEMAGKSARRSSAPERAPKPRRILAFDIGGTGLKAAIIGPDGAFITERVRVKTPHHCPPAVMVKTLVQLVKPFKDYDHVSMGFPGYVRDGRVITAPNLGTRAWAGFDLAGAMQKKLRRPVRIVNDADMQGLAVIKGEGLELVCTLGTGFGTAWFRDGELMPHMELAHMPIHGKKDFDAYIGDHARKKIGDKEWNRRVARLLPVLATVLNYDHLYLGGGNSARIRFKLPSNVTITSNDAGMEGGAFVWIPKTKRGKR